MNEQPHAPPRLARIPLQADDQAHALLIVQGERAIEPTGGLCAVLRFVPGASGGWIAAAQAGDQRWGYIDGEGAWIVEPTLRQARSFSRDGIARFCDAQGLWGYLDTAGRVVVLARFADARPMRAGLAAVKTEDGAWRILRLGGDFACDAAFEDLGPFGAPGLARATHQGATGYVNAHGQWVIAPQLRHGRDFEEQSVVPASPDGRNYGLLDATGHWVLSPRYPRLEAFNEEGLAFFAEPDAWTAGHGYIDTQGRVVLRGGVHLSRHMACGLAADHSDDEGTRYRSTRAATRSGGVAGDVPLGDAARDDPHANVHWGYGTAFRTAGCLAVVRRAPQPVQDESERGMGLATQGASQGAWGLLHADGRFVPAPAGLLEPLTRADGWLPQPQPDTALVAFHTHDGQLAWMDGEGAVAWRAHYDGQQAALLDAQGRLLWHSATREHCWPPRPFFHAPLVDLLEGLNGVDQIATLAVTLAASAERRLQALAAGQRAEADAGVLQSAPAAAAPDREEADRRATAAARRVLRTTLGAAHQATYGFLAPERERMLREGRRVLAQHLGQRHGTPDQQPDHAAPQGCEGDGLLAWAVPLAQPVAGSEALLGVPDGTLHLWISLYARRSLPAGGGESVAALPETHRSVAEADTDQASGHWPTDRIDDAWWELWLMAAPSLAALRAAQAVRDEWAALAASDTVEQPAPASAHAPPTDASHANRLPDPAPRPARSRAEMPLPEPVAAGAAMGAPAVPHTLPSTLPHTLSHVVLPPLSPPMLGDAEPAASAPFHARPARPAGPAPAFHAMAAQLSHRPARTPMPQAPQSRRITPAMALMAHFVLSVMALACHASVALAAWRAEGLWAGLGTLVFMGFAELYWAWRFVFQTPESLALAAAAMGVVLYLFVWCVVYRRMGQTLSAHGATA